MLGKALDSVDDGQNCGDAECGAHDVRSACPRIAEFGQELWADDEKQHHDRDVDEKTEPHQKNCRSIPPISGPIAPPAEKLAIHTPIAKVRCLGSRNMERSSDKVEGASVAAASPKALVPP